MRNTAILGFLLVIGVFALSLDGDFSFYFQKHSIIIVMGGTAAIFIFSNPVHTIKKLFVSVSRLGSSKDQSTAYKEDLVQLAKSKKLTEKETSHPLLTYASELWEQGVDPQLFVVLLSQKRNELISSELEIVQSLKNLAKYPPALGMAGTVMGMVELFLNLDSNEGSIGASLAFAMTATFFGIILTNALISPLADRLHVKTVKDKRVIVSLYEIVLLINGDNPSSLIIDEVNSRAA